MKENICSSLAVIQTVSSITNRIMSDSDIIFLIKVRSSSKVDSQGLSESITFQISFMFAVCSNISTVVHAISVTIALNCHISLLNNVDFHTFVAHTSQIFIFPKNNY